MVDTSPQQQCKSRKTQGRFRVSSEHSCVCKMYTEAVELWRKYSQTERPRGWGTPFTSRVSFVPPFLRRMMMCDTCIIFSPLFLHLNGSLHLPQESPQSRLWKFESPPFGQGGDPLWSRTAFSGFGLTLCGLECLDGCSCAVCQVY